MVLTHEEHMEFHGLVRDRFLRKYPHLKGRKGKGARQADGEKQSKARNVLFENPPSGKQE